LPATIPQSTDPRFTMLPKRLKEAGYMSYTVGMVLFSPYQPPSPPSNQGGRCIVRCCWQSASFWNRILHSRNAGWIRNGAGVKTRAPVHAIRQQVTSGVPPSNIFRRKFRPNAEGKWHQGSAYAAWTPVGRGMCAFFHEMLTLEDAVGSHSCSLETRACGQWHSSRVFTPLVRNVHFFQTLKGSTRVMDFWAGERVILIRLTGCAYTLPARNPFG
jgi:hypothetical protein